jgi:DNA-binding NarL/FixJ family response regulator
MIRLYVIEDHLSIIVAGLKRMFYSTRDGIEVTGEAADVKTAIQSADPGSFDIFILDLWLANRQPIENIRHLRTHFKDKPIIIYTSETSLVWKRRMLEEKAMAYITKSATRAEIKKAIDAVASGSVYYPVNLEEIGNQEKTVIINDHQDSLTPVDKEILLMLMQGHSHKEIAAIIGKSPSRLEVILKKLRKQFNVKNNIELVSKLKEFGNSL